MKQVIHTELAPAAIGPYSQAYETNGLVITSGQLPVNPADGAMPEGIAAQADRTVRVKDGRIVHDSLWDGVLVDWSAPPARVAP